MLDAVDRPLALPLALLLVACGVLAWLTYPARLSVERIDRPTGAVTLMRARPAGDPGGLVIGAQGTNSHREIFLPLAWELARRGWALAAVDSRTLSTDDGIAIRARELLAVRDMLAPLW